MPRRRQFDANGNPRVPTRDDGALTTARGEAACHARRLGLPKALIAKLIGVQRSTLFDWLTRGKYESDKLYNDFYDKFAQAEAEGAHGYLTIVADVARGGTVTNRKVVTKPNGQTEVSESRQPPNAMAAQWVLERIFPREFGPNKLEIALLEAQNKHLTERLAKLAGLGDTTGEAGPAQLAAGGAAPAGAAHAADAPHGAGSGGSVIDGVRVPFELF